MGKGKGKRERGKGKGKKEKGKGKGKKGKRVKGRKLNQKRLKLM